MCVSVFSVLFDKRFLSLHQTNLYTPEGEEDREQNRDNLVSYRHDSLTVDFICLTTVDPFSQGDAAEPEKKERYETK